MTTFPYSYKEYLAAEARARRIEANLKRKIPEASSTHKVIEWVAPDEWNVRHQRIYHTCGFSGWEDPTNNIPIWDEEGCQKKPWTHFHLKLCDDCYLRYKRAMDVQRQRNKAIRDKEDSFPEIPPKWYGKICPFCKVLETPKGRMTDFCKVCDRFMEALQNLTPLPFADWIKTHAQRLEREADLALTWLYANRPPVWNPEAGVKWYAEYQKAVSFYVSWLDRARELYESMLDEKDATFDAEYSRIWADWLLWIQKALRKARNRRYTDKLLALA